ncbi:MAG: hypothetical protein JW846_06875, partial [Dehalococcoidia bacterium]|nr:hypothetical protein [Dehalococcoidia bacterium]
MRSSLARVLSVVGLLSLVLVGCQGASATEESFPVPERADAIAKVKLAEILNDADTADLYAYSAALVGD